MTLGVIMLDTGFRRFPGDIGDPGSHKPPALFERVPGATAARVVGGVASLTDPTLRADALKPFITAGERLVAQGATAITTSCGFLVAYQHELAQALPVPVLTSALCLLPEIARSLSPDGQIGVLTFDPGALTSMHFAAAGFQGESTVAGLDPDCGFRRAVLSDLPDDSLAAREADVLRAARHLRDKTPHLAVVVLECTNFPPHREAVAALLRVPVHDIWDCVRQLAGATGDQAPSDR
jgi:Asp/Glu/Hydantoin racemase